MNLDNYKHIVCSTIQKMENEEYLLISDDHKAVYKTCEAYNTIAMVKNTKDIYYVGCVHVYLKKE